MEGFGRSIFPGLLAITSAIPVAVLLSFIAKSWSASPEKAVAISGIVLVSLGIIPPAAYLAANRGAARLSALSVISVGSVSVLLIACYLFVASSYIFLPADIVIWSESDFVNDILKFRTGYPIFTAQVNNESFTYVPGTQLITYLLASLSGFATSIPAYRIIQLIYTLAAAIVAFFCVRRIVSISAASKKGNLFSGYWSVVWFSLLFLIATNSLTNPFSHLLHNDALAQLVTIAAYWLLVEYQATGNKRLILIMVILPALGFWVKQSLVIWVVLYAVYFLIFDRPVSIRRALGFGAAAGAMAMLSYSIGYLIWQENFTYWTFTVLGSHAVSPLRSFRHLLLVWPYLAMGLVGGLVILRSSRSTMFGIWLIWLVVFLSETYTSGIAWMTNHIGPGSLIAGVWALAAATISSQRFAEMEVRRSEPMQWLTTGIVTIAALLLMNGLGMVRVPVSGFNESDAHRYIQAIEKEFVGEPQERVLLDIGTWVYLDNGIVMKDRAPSIGERGISETGDFSGINGRLSQRYYTKVLVRNYHSGDFWYDHELWRRSSGIRQALDDNYREIRRIEPVAGIAESNRPYPFHTVSVLVPR